MSKRRYKSYNPAEMRQDLINSYEERFFNLFLNRYESEGLSRDQREYILRRLWSDGTVAAFSIIKPQRNMFGVNAESFSNGLVGFAPFTVDNYNMYNYPTGGYLINERGVPYIPNKHMSVNVNVVLGYAQHTRQPLHTIVYDYIKRIVDVEMTIRTNLIAHKLPFVLEVTADSSMKTEAMMDKITNDEPVVIVPVKTVDAINNVASGTPYIIDKLQAYKVALENEALTFIGINNVGGQEKKERMLVDEVNANNDLINDYGNAIDDCINEFCEEIERVLGHHVRLTRKASSQVVENEESEGEDDENENVLLDE